MENFIYLLEEINIAQIFIIFSGLWVFYNRLDKKISKIEKDIKDDIVSQSFRIDQQSARSDQLYTMFIDLLKSRKNSD